MATKHTPGPWTYNYAPSTGFGCGYGKSQIIDSQNRPLAAVASVAPQSGEMYKKGTMSQATIDELEANAALIAAAPELLEACRLSEAVLAEHEQYDDDDEIPSRESEAAQACRDALAKATPSPK